jgi:hypothetical protein
VAIIVAVPEVAAASECDDPEPAWLLCEDFEDGGLGWTDWYAQSSWTECAGCPDGVNDPDRIRLEQDAGLAHDGEWSVTMPGTSENFTGGTLRYATCEGEQQAGCTLQGHDRLYFRTWVRLAADHDYVHHFLGLGGSRPDGYWDANGNAGCRPNGERWAGTRVDLDPSHELFFYTYFPEMNCDSGGYCSGSYADDICNGCASIDMACSDGPECCWGNHFRPEAPVVLATETWTCIEMMMELNTPGQADGSMAFWIDDGLGHMVEGMAWRDVSELQLNRAILEHYIEPGDTDHPNQVWFDDVVVSTERIGCSSTPGGDDGGTGSAAEEGGNDESGSPGDGTSSGAGQTGGATSPTTADGAGDGSDGGEATGDGGMSGMGQEPGDAGCGCRASPQGLPVAALAWWLVPIVVRRRRPILQ